MRRTVKTVGFFNHLPHIAEADADRYYLGAHVPFIADMMESTGFAHSYYTAKVVAQQDINGTWLQRPDDWRSVAIRVALPENYGGLAESHRTAIEQDHRKLLHNLRNYLCEERTIVSDLDARPSTTKFIIEVASAPGEFSEARSHADAFAGAVESELDPGTGIALAIANHVRYQEQALPIDVPGQGFTPGKFVEEPATALILELYFVTARVASGSSSTCDRCWQICAKPQACSASVVSDSSRSARSGRGPATPDRLGRQERPPRVPAGPRPVWIRSFRTLVADIRIPSPASSPTICR